METTHLGKQDWMRAARRALIHGGPAAVRVEKLARDLKVTKGSFYWHFKDRGDLLESLLREWEEETSTLFSRAMACRDPRDGLRYLAGELERSVASPPGEYPPDAAIFNWAAVSPHVAQRVNRIERRRIDMLTQLTGGPDRAELGYLVWLGFVSRRHRFPATAESYPLISALLFDLLQPKRWSRPKTSRPERTPR